MLPEDIAELKTLQAEVAELRREIASMRADERSTEPTPSAEGTRRGLLKLLAGAGVVAIATLADTEPAAAADGNVIAGTLTTSTAPTHLRYGGSTGLQTVLFVNDGVWGTVIPQLTRTAAIVGWSGNWVSDGVLGVSSSGDGYGVRARGEASKSAGLLVSGRRADIVFEVDEDVLPPIERFDQHGRAELLCDQNGDLWFSVAAGQPGEWRRVAGPTTAGSFHLLDVPVRAYSSRDNGAAKLQPSEERTIGLEAANLPDGTSGVLVNLTLTQTDGSGYVALLAADATWAGTSNINWSLPNTDIANQAVTALDASGRCKVRGGGGSTHVIIDVFGYWR
jgi:hypothetical protein